MRYPVVMRIRPKAHRLRMIPYSYDARDRRALAVQEHLAGRDDLPRLRLELETSLDLVTYQLPVSAADDFRDLRERHGDRAVRNWLRIVMHYHLTETRR